MKDRGKALESYGNAMDSYSSSDLPCRKHPFSSSVGICAYCLKDRLINLVCSDCGEQRLSSCSCSEISSNRNSCAAEVGSVGRVSFLLENERIGVPNSHSKPKLVQEKSTDEPVLLKRSSSSCVEIKKSGFWRLGRLFRKKRDKGFERQSVAGFDEKSDIWTVDYMGVSRSRSMCSFRGGGAFGSEDGENLVVSGGRSSISGARTSSVNGGLVFDSGRRSGFSEAEPRKSGFDGEKRPSGVSESDYGADSKGLRRGVLLDHETGLNLANRRVFSLKESDFNGMDDSGFIDLKLDFGSELRPELPAVRIGFASDSESAFGSRRAADLVALEGSGGFLGGGSCRITVGDGGDIRKGRKSLKALRWIFRQHPNRGSSRKKDGDLVRRIS